MLTRLKIVRISIQSMIQELNVRIEYLVVMEEAIMGLFHISPNLIYLDKLEA